MKTIDKRFPYIFDKSTMILPEYFETNGDKKINFSKRLKNLGVFYADVQLELCKEEFYAFTTYLNVDLESSKHLFYGNLNVQGEYEELLLDIVSYPQVSMNSSKFQVSFKVAILSKLKYLT